jgi:hypothetical protein
MKDIESYHKSNISKIQNIVFIKEKKQYLYSKSTRNIMQNKHNIIEED